MKMNTVSSSNIQSVGYEPATETLAVKFHDGGTYNYNGVPESIYNAMLGADSVGMYLNRVIKPSYRGVRA